MDSRSTVGEGGGGGKREARTLTATVRFTSEEGRVKLIFI